MLLVGRLAAQSGLVELPELQVLDPLAPLVLDPALQLPLAGLLRVVLVVLVLLVPPVPVVLVVLGCVVLVRGGGLLPPPGRSLLAITEIFS